MARASVGLGLIGAGGTFGTFIQSALRDVEGGRLAGIADVNEKALQEARQKLGVEHAYTDWRQLIADDEVGAVIVATPPFTQHEIARAVLERGKALFLEKPGSVAPEDLRELVDLQRSKRVRATIDYVMRWNPLLDVVRDICRGGWLGALRSMQFVNYAQDETLPKGHWFWDRSKSGGIFVEHGVHFFDLYGEIAGSLRRRWSLRRRCGTTPLLAGELIRWIAWSRTTTACCAPTSTRSTVPRRWSGNRRSWRSITGS